MLTISKEQHERLDRILFEKMQARIENTIARVFPETCADKTPNWYDDSKGHKGSHCFQGIPAGQARYDSYADWQLSRCVMYGASNGYSAFCADCASAVRKVDISDGWPAF